jgi:hypothetical protein
MKTKSSEGICTQRPNRLASAIQSNRRENRDHTRKNQGIVREMGRCNEGGEPAEGREPWVVEALGGLNGEFFFLPFSSLAGRMCEKASIKRNFGYPKLYKLGRGCYARSRLEGMNVRAKWATVPNHPDCICATATAKVGTQFSKFPTAGSIALQPREFKIY